MDVIIGPGNTLAGTSVVPGDKSIAHRWLILAATADGSSRVAGLPPSLDVRSTAACLASLSGKSRPSLDVFARNASSPVDGGGSTWNTPGGIVPGSTLEVEGEGREGLRAPEDPLDCGNSGTSMRLLAGVLAAAPFRTVLTGDPSLSSRPMERVAEPLRSMGATIETTDGHAPMTVSGGALRGTRFAPRVPSAQVKSAVLFAGLAADGETTVVEPAATRDHTERALAALGAPIHLDEEGIQLSRFHHGGFEGVVPGDVSSAAFLIAAAALTGSRITIAQVGLNPSRIHFLDVMERMGIRTNRTVLGSQVGEPIGTIEVEGCDGIRAVRIEPSEIPLIIDEVPVLAVLAAHAPSDSWFLDASELRVKETDRLGAIASGIRALGGHAADEGSDLVVAGGGLSGGRADAGGDHRMAMALVVAALAAGTSCRIGGIEAADVSFPGFVDTLRSLGVDVQEVE
ncbi:MAG TPA: 3-phosphoshikimate 1-carboxyvinyltransferase [Actinomycetota bacterium]|nr:3-phosphoshikimate 1-carboxyvinyltransferase [Actinomycetota bacterium]